MRRRQLPRTRPLPCPRRQRRGMRARRRSPRRRLHACAGESPQGAARASSGSRIIQASQMPRPEPLVLGRPPQQSQASGSARRVARSPPCARVVTARSLLRPYAPMRLSRMIRSASAFVLAPSASAVSARRRCGARPSTQTPNGDCDRCPDGPSGVSADNECNCARGGSDPPAHRRKPQRDTV